MDWMSSQPWQGSEFIHGKSKQLVHQPIDLPVCGLETMRSNPRARSGDRRERSTMIVPLCDRDREAPFRDGLYPFLEILRCAQNDRIQGIEDRSGKPSRAVRIPAQTEAVENIGDFELTRYIFIMNKNNLEFLMPLVVASLLRNEDNHLLMN